MVSVCYFIRNEYNSFNLEQMVFYLNFKTSDWTNFLSLNYTFSCLTSVTDFLSFLSLTTWFYSILFGFILILRLFKVIFELTFVKVID